MQEGKKSSKKKRQPPKRYFTPFSDDGFKYLITNGFPVFQRTGVAHDDKNERHRRLKKLVEVAFFLADDLFVEPMFVSVFEENETVILFIHDFFGFQN